MTITIEPRVGDSGSQARTAAVARPQHQCLQVVQPVLLVRAGTETHRFGPEHQSWRDRLDTISQRKVAEVSLDTADLVSIFRLPRASTLQLAVPRDLDLVFDDPASYPELAAALMPGYHPLTTDDGGTLPRNDACIALFDQEPEVTDLLQRGLAAALRIPESGYSRSGHGRGVSVYLHGFAGGTSCAGMMPFLPPLLQSVAHGARADLWLSLQQTLQMAANLAMNAWLPLSLMFCLNSLTTRSRAVQPVWIIFATISQRTSKIAYFNCS